MRRGERRQECKAGGEGGGEGQAGEEGGDEVYVCCMCAHAAAHETVCVCVVCELHVCKCCCTCGGRILLYMCPQSAVCRYAKCFERRSIKALFLRLY